MGDLAGGIVKKAARFAVYNSRIKIVHIHHIPRTNRPEVDVGVVSPPTEI